MPSAVWPSAGCSSSSCVADLAVAGHRQRLRRRQRQRRRALDVVLVVERRAARAARAPGSALQALRGRLADAQRRVGERVAAEQVVPVGVGDEQPDDAEARLLGDRGQHLELVRQHRRVDAERLLAGAHERAGRLPDARRDDHDVGVEADGAALRLRRRRAAWPPRGGSSPRRSASSARIELLLVAVDPDHGDLGLHARLDVVVVARRHVHPALLAADAALALLEVRGVGLVGADLLRGDDEVEVRLEVAARLAEQLVVDVGDQPDLNFFLKRSSCGLVSLNGGQRLTESGRKPEREGSSGQPSCLAICTAVRRRTSA